MATMRLRRAHPSHQDRLILTLSSMFTVPNLFGAWQRQSVPTGSLDPNVDADGSKRNLPTLVASARSGMLTKGSTSPYTSYHVMWTIPCDLRPSEVFYTAFRSWRRTCKMLAATTTSLSHQIHTWVQTDQPRATRPSRPRDLPNPVTTLQSHSNLRINKPQTLEQRTTHSFGIIKYSFFWSLTLSWFHLLFFYCPY